VTADGYLDDQTAGCIGGYARAGSTSGGSGTSRARRITGALPTLALPAGAPMVQGPLRGRHRFDLPCCGSPPETASWGFNSVLWAFNSAARSSGPVCGAVTAIRKLPGCSGCCHCASRMTKRSGAAAAVRPGPAALFRLTDLDIFRRSHARTGRAARCCRLFAPADRGPAGSFRVSLGW
jgi:hypothetical protein